MLGAIFGYLMLIKLWRKERDVYRIEWKIKFADISFCFPNNSSSQKIAKHKEDSVVVNRLRKKHVCDNRSLNVEMAMLKSLCHCNVAKFIGACIENGRLCSVWENCSIGTLEDVLDNPKMRLESRRFSVAIDICSGLHYLHAKGPGYHGRLKTTNCLVSGITSPGDLGVDQWSVKLSDFGMATLRKGEDQTGDKESQEFYKGLLWTAPERLQCVLDKKPQKLTKASDIYSLGIVLKQVFCANAAYSGKELLSTKDIIHKIAYPDEDKALMRPETDEIQRQHRRPIADSLQQLVESCWTETALDRPTAKLVYKRLKRLRPPRGSSSHKKMQSHVKRYSTQLERVLQEQVTHQGSENIDSKSVASLPTQIKGQSNGAKVYKNVTICFCNVVDFVDLIYQSSPSEIVDALNKLHSHFENTVKDSRVSIVETIGDAIMLASGCPIVEQNHANAASEVALALLDSVGDFTMVNHLSKARLSIRIGIHSGPVVAGVVGNTWPKFCLFGKTVDVASQMESQGQAQKIHTSVVTVQLLKDDKFLTEKRGMTQTKGKGSIQTYWLTENKK